MILQWIELLLLLGKTALLSCLYTATILAGLYVLRIISGWPLSKRFLAQKRWIAAMIYVPVYILLLTISFSYWEDTGMGEHARLPIGYKQAIYNEDLQMTYFFEDPANGKLNRDEINIDRFRVSHQWLCAELADRPAGGESGFLVYDMAGQEMIHFPSASSYDQHAKFHHLSLSADFHDFRWHMHAYLEQRPAWKRWLLP